MAALPSDGGRPLPALIVFAREPVAGRVKSRLIARLGAQAAARLADAFIIDALAKAGSFRGCKLVIAGSAPGSVRNSPYFNRIARRFGTELIDQGGGDLGRRMARVLAAYAEGTGAVLFGTDTPSLPRAFIRQSIDALREAPVVVAPALDGGYYLVAVRGRGDGGTISIALPTWTFWLPIWPAACAVVRAYQPVRRPCV